MNVPRDDVLTSVQIHTGVTVVHVGGATRRAATIATSTDAVLVGAVTALGQ